jgi:hypothetical protein
MPAYSRVVSMRNKKNKLKIELCSFRILPAFILLFLLLVGTVTASCTTGTDTCLDCVYTPPSAEAVRGDTVNFECRYHKTGGWGCGLEDDGPVKDTDGGSCDITISGVGTYSMTYNGASGHEHYEYSTVLAPGTYSTEVNCQAAGYDARGPACVDPGWHIDYEVTCTRSCGPCTHTHEPVITPSKIYYDTPVSCSASAEYGGVSVWGANVSIKNNGVIVNSTAEGYSDVGCAVACACNKLTSTSIIWTGTKEGGDTITCEEFSGAACCSIIAFPVCLIQIIFGGVGTQTPACPVSITVQPYPTNVLAIGAPPDWAYYGETAIFQCQYQYLESPYDTRHCIYAGGLFTCDKTSTSYTNIALCNANCPPDGDYVYTAIPGSGATCTATIDGTPNPASWDGITYSYSTSSLPIGIHTSKCDCSYSPNYGSASTTTTYEIKPRKTGITAKTKPANPVEGSPVKFICNYSDIVNAMFPIYLSGATCHAYVGPAALGPFTEYDMTENVTGQYYWYSMLAPPGTNYWKCECSKPNYETSTSSLIVLSSTARDYAHGLCFGNVSTDCNVTYPAVVGLQSHSKDDPAEEVPTKYPLNGTSPTNLNASSLQIIPMTQSGSAFFSLIGLNETLENIIGRSELTGNTKMPPMVIVTSPLCDGYYHKLNVPLQWILFLTTDQPVSLINYTLDGGPEIIIIGNTTISGLSNGVHNLTVQADGGSSPSIIFRYCLADINKDLVVDAEDLAIFVSAFGTACDDPAYNPDADLNDDCLIEMLDSNILLSAIGSICPSPTGVTCPQPTPEPIFISGIPYQVVPGDPRNRKYTEIVGVSGGGKIGDIFNVSTDYQVVISLYNITTNASNIAEFVKSPLVNLSLDTGASLYISSDYDHDMGSNTTIDLVGTDNLSGNLVSFFQAFPKPYTAGTKILLPAPSYRDLYVVKFNKATPGETISIWAGSREASRTPIPLLNVSELDVTSKEVIAQVLPNPRALEITSNVSSFSGKIEGTTGETSVTSTNFATASNSVTTGGDLYTNIFKIYITGSSPYQNFEIKTTPLSNQPNDPVGIIRILPKEFAETMYINKTGTYLFGSMDRFMLDIPDNLSLGFHNFSYLFIDRFNNTFIVPYGIYLRLPTALVTDVVAERDADDANLTHISFKGVLLYTRLDEPTLQPSHPAADENVSIYVNNITENYQIDSKPPAPPYHQYGWLMNLTTNATGEFNSSFDIRGWGRFYIISLFNGTNVLAPSLSIKPFYGGGIAVVFGNPQTLIPILLVFLSIFLRKSLRRVK